MQRATTQGRSGFTTIELVVVFAILSLLAALAVPSFRTVRSNARLREAASDVADALAVARSQAIASGHRYVVYFDTGINSNQDICGNDLVDTNGNPAPIAIIDDGEPGSANYNCCADAGDPVRTLPAADGVQWGVDFATAPAPNDADPGGNYALGSSFSSAGAATEWVAFGPDGLPVGFANVSPCTTGSMGSGAGAIYVNNDLRDIAVVLTPLGTVRTHAFERAGATWTE